MPTRQRPARATARRRRVTFRAVWCASAAIACLATAGAHAQQALDPPLADPPDAQTGGGVEQVTVTGSGYAGAYTVPNASTGTKTDTPLMDTPLSVQVVPQQVLLDQFSLSLEQALSNVSGVFSGGEEPGQEFLYIRGFVTTATMWNGLRIDEYSNGGGGTVGAVPMDNVDKLEVLKGPASILYGRVEPGGMVNVITKQPTDQPYGSVALSLGSWHYEWAGVDLGGPIDEQKRLLYRLNATEEHSDSWLWGGSMQALLAAPVLEWRIGADTRIALEGEFRHEANSGGISTVPVDPSTGQMINVPMAYSPLTDSYAVDLSRYFVHLSHAFSSDWSVSAKLLATQSVVPVALDTYISMANFPPAGPKQLTITESPNVGYTTNKTDAATVDFVGHVHTLGTANTLLFGADMYHTPIHFATIGDSCCYPTNYYAPGPLPPNAALVGAGPEGYAFGGDTYFASTDYGLYLQDQVKLPGEVHLLLGERYQHYYEHTSTDAYLEGPLSAYQPLDDHVFTPRAGALWRVRDWLSLYYSFAENFGNNNGFAFPNVPLRPETSKQSEIGAKTEFFGGRLASSLAAYNLTKFDIASQDPAHPNFDILVGEIRSKGVEYDLQGALTRNWDAILNFSYVQPYVVIGASGAESGETLYASESIVAGQRSPGVPEHLFNAWTTYRLPQPALAGWRVGGGANWAASAAYPGTYLSQPAYWTGSLLVAYEHRQGRLKTSLQLNVANVFNRLYYVNMYPWLPGNYTDLNYGNPRQFKLTARVEF